MFGSRAGVCKSSMPEVKSRTRVNLSFRGLILRPVLSRSTRPDLHGNIHFGGSYSLRASTYGKHSLRSARGCKAYLDASSRIASREFPWRLILLEEVNLDHADAGCLRLPAHL